MPARDRLSWFRWNPQDHEADPAVQAMTDEQRGKYERVRNTLYMRNIGTATEDEIRVWARCSESEWPRHREALVRAFKVRRDGRWLQRRVELEAKAARRRVERASQSGRAGARKRWSSVAVPRRSDS